MDDRISDFNFDVLTELGFTKEEISTANDTCALLWRLKAPRSWSMNIIRFSTPRINAEKRNTVY